MSSITINGNRINVSGGSSSVTIRNGEVTVNGVLVADGLSGIVEVKWEGPAASVESDCAVTCGNVDGNVSAGGSVNCGDVTGSLNSGGSVRCGKVGGNINAGGSVRVN